MIPSILPRLCVAASVLVLLAGCASAGAGAPAGTASHDAMDKQAMCSKHREMMAGKSPQERQSMMQSMMPQCH